jgi:hypothetical protein
MIGAGVSVISDPGGVAACSHGWSIAALGDAQPVESVVWIEPAPAGAEESSAHARDAATPDDPFLCPSGAEPLRARAFHGFRPRSAGSTRGYIPSSLRDENRAGDAPPVARGGTPSSLRDEDRAGQRATFALPWAVYSLP